jgi:hypothetical protein
MPAMRRSQDVGLRIKHPQDICFHNSYQEVNMPAIYIPPTSHLSTPDLVPALASFALGPVLFITITLSAHLFSKTLRRRDHIILVI